MNAKAEIVLLYQNPMIIIGFPHCFWLIPILYEAALNHLITLTLAMVGLLKQSLPA